MYQQQDEVTTPGTSGVMRPGSSGVIVGHYFLYWLASVGGWGVHTSIGSEQVMLYFREPRPNHAHELHHRAGWSKAVGGENSGDLVR